MSEMIEWAAKAVQESKAWPAACRAGTAEELARAALASTRDPTPSMIQAGAKTVRWESPSDSDDEMRECAAAVWRAMNAAMMAPPEAEK